MTAIPAEFPAFVATKSTGDDGKEVVSRSVSTLRADQLPAGDVMIRVGWSSVNFKDALATIPKGGVARISPLAPGVDLAGVVVEAAAGCGYDVGDEVLAHGFDIGTGRHGGYAHFCRLNATQLVRLPKGLTARDAMTIGTGGFTAAQSVHALEQFGLTASAGPVLVTGATGGVGSAAVGILAKRGYEVVASTGKAEQHAFLRELGATDVIDRAETSAESTRPLEAERWAAVVDCVGGTTLAYALRTLKYGGAVAASGLTGGAALATTVIPFIIRGANLLGVDSVNMDHGLRTAIWNRCATDLRPTGLDTIANEITLDGLDAALTEIHAGKVRGRYVVRVAAD